MTHTIPTWGYRAGESRIFDLPADNPKLPEGWYDSPALIPTEDLANLPPPPAPAPSPSVDEQEEAERRRAIEENQQLRARNEELELRVIELEEQLAHAGQPESPDTREPERRPKKK